MGAVWAWIGRVVDVITRFVVPVMVYFQGKKAQRADDDATTLETVARAKRARDDVMRFADERDRVRKRFRKD